MSIRAVTFDAGGTLFRPIASVGEIYATVALRHGCRTDARVIDERFGMVWAARSGRVAGMEMEPASPGYGGKRGEAGTPAAERAWWKALVRDVFEGEASFGDFDAFFEELHALFAEPGIWKLYTEVPGTLDRLRRDGLRLAIVSNWDSRLEALTTTLGIREHFEVVVSSGGAGVSKPDPRIFQLAVDRLECAPGEVLHVGDSLRDDVWGAHRAGLQPLWLRRTASGQGDPAGREFEALMQRGVETVASLEAILPRVLT